MKIAVLGTGIVGQAHAGRLAELGDEVVMGTMDVAKTMAKSKTDRMGRPPLRDWLKDNPKVQLTDFAAAAKQGRMVIVALNGQITLQLLGSIKNELTGKVLVDITNPLDFSSGELQLFVSNNDSLGEQIQKTLPKTKVVKAFNTMNASVQVAPASVAKADHHLFIAGNSKAAKTQVSKLAESYGWKNIIDLGDITSARGMEMILPIWLKTMNALQTPNFNFKITK